MNASEHLFEVIGALVDGERVDPASLKTALATDEGRQYLVDLMALRELTGEDAAASDAGTTRALVPPLGRRVFGSRPWLRGFAAAAALVAAVAGGYTAGRRAAPTPPPTRMTTAPGDAYGVPAPMPTSVIRLEPGVDWHEQTARN